MLSFLLLFTDLMLQRLRSLRYTTLGVLLFPADRISYLQLSLEDICCGSPKDLTLNEHSFHDLDAIAGFLQPRLAEMLTTGSQACNGVSISTSVDKEDLLFWTSHQRERGNQAFAEHDFILAYNIFMALHIKNPQDAVLQLDISRAQLALGDSQNAWEGFKKVVSLVRRRGRHGISVKAANVPGSDEENEICTAFTSQHLIHTAYTGMGAALLAMDKTSRAITCYILALKQISSGDEFTPKISLYHPNSTNALPSSPPPSPVLAPIPSPLIPNSDLSISVGYFRSVDVEQELSFLLSAHNMAVDKSFREGTSGARKTAHPTPIEEALSLHSIKSLHDPFSFSCTMCGECCRTSDNIMLTPLDIFDMTRWNVL